MIPAPRLANDAQRVKRLRSLELLDTPSEAAFDALTAMAAQIAKAPIALVSLVDHDRQWFKSRFGLDAPETPRDISFCGWAIQSSELFWVADAARDERFHDNPLVTNAPGIRFYAGMPIILADGTAIGTLCVIDREPRAYDPFIGDTLRGLAKVCAALCEMRSAHHKLLDAEVRADVAARTKAALLTNVSHELQTPLNGIVGASEALARTPLDAGQSEMIDLITGSAAKLSTLIADLIDVSRLASADLELSLESFSLEEVVARAVAVNEPAAEAKGVALVCEDQRIGRFLGDPERLRQVVGRLVSNAVKYTHKGGVKVWIESEEVPDGVRASIVVQDTGVGMDLREIERRFEPFSTVDDSLTRSSGGLGVGLALSRKLAHQMGGEIEFRASSDAGTTVAFTLELQRAAARDPHQTDLFDPQVAGRTIRILHADDHPANRRVVDLMLSDVPVSIVSVENGLMAVQAFKADRFDLVLMDVQMPVMDGLTAIRAIRDHERASGCPPTVICVLSAHGLPEHVSASLKAGADRHLSKPLKPRDLLQAVASSVEHIIQHTKTRDRRHG